MRFGGDSVWRRRLEVTSSSQRRRPSGFCGRVLRPGGAAAVTGPKGDASANRSDRKIVAVSADVFRWHVHRWSVHLGWEHGTSDLLWHLPHVGPGNAAGGCGLCAGGGLALASL